MGNIERDVLDRATDLLLTMGVTREDLARRNVVLSADVDARREQLRGAVEVLCELDEMLRPMPPFNPVRVKVREAVERFRGQ